MANPISTTAYLVDPAWIIANLPVASNLAEEDIKPFVLMAQAQYIKPMLGGKLYQKLMDDIAASSLTGNYEILRQFFRTGLSYYTIALAIPFLNYKIRPKGVMSGNADNAASADLKTIIYLRNELNNQGELEFNNVKEWLTLNTGLFPEYNTNVQPPYPDSSDEFTSGIYFGENFNRKSFGSIMNKKLFPDR